MREAILKAMRADCIPAGNRGRWTVKKTEVTPDLTVRVLMRDGVFVPAGNYTYLFCLTTATMMNPPGEVVMDDKPSELRKHLEFIFKARGKVLVGGLGLGCVVRGLIEYGKVDSIDIIERSSEVLNLCAHSVDHPRVTIHWGDAVKDGIQDGTWDYIWWDLWNDPEREEPHLAVIHAQLIKDYRKRCVQQGAWALPRRFRRSLRSCGVI